MTWRWFVFELTDGVSFKELISFVKWSAERRTTCVVYVPKSLVKCTLVLLMKCRNRNRLSCRYISVCIVPYVASDVFISYTYSFRKNIFFEILENTIIYTWLPVGRLCQLWIKQSAEQCFCSCHFLYSFVFRSDKKNIYREKLKSVTAESKIECAFAVYRFTYA
jgi:hypothetical protein